MKKNIIVNHSELDNLEELIKLKLQNPEFRENWEDLDGNYQFVKLMIQNRVETNMSRKDLAIKVKTSVAVITRIEQLSVSITTSMGNRIANTFGKNLELKFV